MRLKLSYAFSENWWVELEREREKLREKGGGGRGREVQFSPPQVDECCPGVTVEAVGGFRRSAARHIWCDNVKTGTVFSNLKGKAIQS